MGVVPTSPPALVAHASQGAGFDTAREIRLAGSKANGLVSGRVSIRLREDSIMCRNIKTLFNFKPPATDEEIQASALQFVRKLSGFNTPSAANAAAFDLAVEQVTRAARTLIDSLVTAAPAKDREVERAKAKAQALKRFGPR